MTLSDNEYQRGEEVWKAETLILFAKAKEYPVRDIPLWAINLHDSAFNCDNLYNFLYQCQRVRDCSLDYPIILDNHGQIADGYHRVCRAILEGRESIKAIRLEEMPTPDRIDRENA